MEVSHADLAEVTGMVLVDVDLMVMHTTRHTATTRMLAMLADTTVAGGDVAATVKVVKSVSLTFGGRQL